ncbi:acylneuraminate cytidylyltransferase family protein [Dasania marina]|uniref:acylneuraminate cytidylyltransferase family protein n=1 Tax=Dasania marina TaxID=471499 RepID=UPI0030DC8849
MIEDKRVLAIITARGGSKGVSKKNILPIGGRPLIAWTIAAAKKSQYIDRVILSSDSQEIIDVAQQFGCEVPFVRPANLATDSASSVDVVLHALGAINEAYDYLVLLQPTSIFRSAEDIDQALRLCKSSAATACVSVVESDKPPYWMYHLEHNQLVPVIQQELKYSRRQDCPASYELNGAVYVVNITDFQLQKTFLTNDAVAYVMPKSRSLDIDTAEDVAMATYQLGLEGGK